jgi:hypothetical protein
MLDQIVKALPDHLKGSLEGEFLAHYSAIAWNVNEAGRKVGKEYAVHTPKWASIYVGADYKQVNALYLETLVDDARAKITRYIGFVRDMKKLEPCLRKESKGHLQNALQTSVNLSYTIDIVKELRLHDNNSKQAKDGYLKLLMAGKITPRKARDHVLPAPKEVQPHKPDVLLPSQITSRVQHLASCGVNINDAMSFASDSTYNGKASFVAALEKVFTSNGLPKEEANFLLEVHPHLLHLPENVQIDYVSTVSEYYRFRNAKQVGSVLLPRDKPEIFNSVRSVRSSISGSKLQLAN